MKRTFSYLLITLILCSSSTVLAAVQANPNQGVFTAVKGQVQIKDAGGQNARAIKNGSKAREGERVVTAPKSSTKVRFFDGSEILLNSGSDLQLMKMQKPSDNDKVFRFKLLVGKMMATVQKLASSKSSFEVEAGGVVCGVRGTKYTLEYDPATGKVTLHVLEGTVWVSADGQTYTFTAGQGATFTNGQLDGQPGPQARGGNDFNPFYGFDGNDEGDGFIILTDTDGLPGIADGTGTDGRVGGNSRSLILQLGFPEYGGGVPAVVGGVKK